MMIFFSPKNPKVMQTFMQISTYLYLSIHPSQFLEPNKFLMCENLKKVNLWLFYLTSEYSC